MTELRAILAGAYIEAARAHVEAHMNSLEAANILWRDAEALRECREIMDRRVTEWANLSNAEIRSAKT